MTDDKNTLAIMLFGELLAADQSVRSRLTRVLPRGMEISHFSVLNSLSWHGGERSPAIKSLFHELLLLSVREDLNRRMPAKPN